MSKDCVLMTLKPGTGHSAYRVAVILKALCEDDSDNGASLGDLEIRGTDRGVEIGYFDYGCTTEAARKERGKGR